MANRSHILPMIVVSLFLTACITQPNAEADLANEINPAVLALGKEVYDANCASCHGVDGEGQPNWKVPDANGVRPAPPHDSSGHTWHHADSLLLEIIANGSSAPGSTMIGYADVLTWEEMEASLEYIKSFWGKDELEFQAKVSQQSGG